MNKVDYNRISNFYNSRYNVSPLKGVEKELKQIMDTYNPKEVIEIGCGTGHWLGLLSSYSCRLFGADSSLGMLSKAKEVKGIINLINANANRLPLRNESFDFIFCINAIHHFANKQSFILDAAKLLKPGGLLCILGLDPRDGNNDWYIYDYFKRTRIIDYERFPTLSEIEEWMNQSGLPQTETKLLEIVEHQKKGREILEDHFLDKKGASQLALLTDEEYEAGLDKIKKEIEIAEQAGREISFNTRLHFYSTMGIKS